MLLLEDETGGRLDTKPVELVRADVLFARGDLDKALRIRREEQLPVYERLGDAREKAVTMGKIADVLASARRSRRSTAHPPRGAAAGL